VYTYMTNVAQRLRCEAMHADTDRHRQTRWHSDAPTKQRRKQRHAQADTKHHTGAQGDTQAHAHHAHTHTIARAARRVAQKRENGRQAWSRTRLTSVVNSSIWIALSKRTQREYSVSNGILLRVITIRETHCLNSSSVKFLLWGLGFRLYGVGFRHSTARHCYLGSARINWLPKTHSDRSCQPASPVEQQRLRSWARRAHCSMHTAAGLQPCIIKYIVIYNVNFLALPSTVRMRFSLTRWNQWPA